MKHPHYTDLPAISWSVLPHRLHFFRIIGATTLIWSLLIGFLGLTVAVGLGAFVLYCRHRIAKVQGKTVAQVNARLSAILQFRSTLERCVPGVLTIVFGIFWVLDRSRQHESDWWVGLPFIPAGWLLILFLARKSWRRYFEIQQMAEKGQNDPSAVGPSSSKIG